ncbi:hypothetical protein FBUS_06760 [Fasciolopsis buskii]|uniref:Uncharacterized protein n=1 Tax=Fasciolopsis buskii TaxID=27845 RepID=A0A8E0SA77_9TREM|nr:hypothetical protein FBUS_06760 [Fasciolopsis buski]
MRPSSLARQRILTEEELRNLEEANERILMDQVIHTALTLSRTNCVPNPKYVYDEFHHDVRTAQMELTKLVGAKKDLMSSLLQNPAPLSVKSLGHAKNNIEIQLAKFMDLAASAHQLSMQSRIVAPLHHRKHLSKGRHSASMLASIRVAPDAWLHRGDPVRVWENSRLASELLHEWSAETPDGTHATTLPAGCLWLTSPESSPASSSRQEHTSRITLFTGHTVEHQEDIGDGSSTGTEAHNGRTQTSESRSKRKKKTRLNLFTNNKALASRIHLFQQGDIESNQAEQLDELKSGLKPLTDYGDNELRSLATSFISKQFKQTAAHEDTQTEELNYFVQTLNAWNNLRGQLAEAKKASSLRSLSQEALVQPFETKQDKRVRSFDSRPDFDPREESGLQSTEASYIRATEPSVGRNDELVTSFAEPAPRTYRILNDGKAQILERKYSTSTPQTPETVGSEKHARTKMSPGLKVNRRDLMTQISTPYIPTLVHCPKCEMEYEVDLFRSPNELPLATESGMMSGYYQAEPEILIPLSPGIVHSRGRRGDHVVCINPPVKVQQADSMPALSLAHEPKYITGDSSLSSRSRPVESVSKMHKRLGRWNKHRPHSFSSATGGVLTPGLTDTTTSSGFGSLTQTPTLEDSEIRTPQEPGKKNADKIRQKSSKISIFKWGKKRKITPESVSPGTDSVGTEPEPTELKSPLIIQRHSPLHVQTVISHSDSNATLTDQSTPKTVLATPIIRSRSWVQQGTPWGYGPPLHEHWHPSTEYIVTQARPHTAYPQSPSERLRGRASRQRVSSNKVFSSVDSERHMWCDYSPTEQLLDSGIQTDTDIIAGLTQRTPQKAKQTQTLEGKLTQEFCPECQAKSMRPPAVHKSIQSEFHLQQIGVGCDLTKSETVSTSCQVGSDYPSKSEPKQVWDVSCQVGVITKSREIAVDGTEWDDKSNSFGEKPETKVTAVQTESQSRPCLVEDANFRKHKQLMYSVSCQVGQVVRTTGSGPEHLDAVQLLDESIEKFAGPSTSQGVKMIMKPISVMVGKKFQVGKPWTDDSESVNNKDEVILHQKPLDKHETSALDVPASGSSLESVPETFSREIQTAISGPVIPYGQPAFETFVQTDNAEKRKLEGSNELKTTESSEKRISESKHPVICARSNWHIMRGPAKASASTMIGCQTAANEQQTDLKFSDIESVLVRPKQAMISAESQTEITSVCQEKQTSSVSIHAVDQLPKQTTDSAVMVKHDPVEPRSAISTRAKRIQKGSPQLLPKGADGFCQTPVFAPETEPIGKHYVHPGAEHRTRRSPMRRPLFQRLVVNVGLYGDAETNGRRHRSLIDCRHLPQDTAELTSESTESSISDTEGTIEAGPRRSHTHHSSNARCISVPSSSLSMCFHLDQSPKTSRRFRKEKHREADTERTERSLSFDDVRIRDHSWEGASVPISDVQCSGTENSARNGTQFNNCSRTDRNASGARRRIDQWKHRHDCYRYY